MCSPTKLGQLLVTEGELCCYGIFFAATIKSDLINVPGSHEKKTIGCMQQFYMTEES